LIDSPIASLRFSRRRESKKAGEREHLYSAFIAEAKRLAAELMDTQPTEELRLEDELENLKFFAVPSTCMRGESP